MLQEPYRIMYVSIPALSDSEIFVAILQMEGPQIKIILVKSEG